MEKPESASTLKTLPPKAPKPGFAALAPPARSLARLPGARHYSVGYLSYRLPTIMDVPEQTQVFVDSLEPRWLYGVKSFSETAIGAVPPLCQHD